MSVHLKPFKSIIKTLKIFKNILKINYKFWSIFINLV